MEFNGCTYLTDEEMSQFYAGDYSTTKLFEGQYVFVGEEVYKLKNNELVRVKYPRIESAFSGVVKPRNKEQIAAIDMLQDEDSTIKLITGTMGTGKTMLLAAQAISLLEKGEYDKIVFIRNNTQVKDTTDLGALPGSEVSKMLPYVMPFADHCGGVDGVMRLIETGKLEIVPLGFLRGRSIRNSIIFCTEAENLTKEHLQLIIARADEGSIIFMDADCRQRDRAVFNNSQGIEIMTDRLKTKKLFSCVHLVKSERSETAALADLLNN